MSVPQKKAVPGAVLSLPPREGPRPESTGRKVSASFQATGTDGSGIIGRVLGTLGYVPGTVPAAAQAEMATLQAQVQSVTSQNNAASAQAGTVEATISQIEGQVSSLVSQEPGLLSQYAGLVSQSESLESEVTSLEATSYALEAEIGGLVSEIDTLKEDLVSDETEIASLQGDLSNAASTVSDLRTQIGGLQSQIAAYANGITGVAAAPTVDGRSDPYTQAVASNGGSTYVQDPDFGQLQLLGNDVDAALGGSVDAYVPASLGFANGYAGLTMASGPNLMDAIRLQTSGGLQPGSLLARLLGYVPASNPSSYKSQIASLESQLASLLSLQDLLQTRLGNDAGALNSANSLLAAAQAAVSALTGLIASAQSRVSALDAQIQGLEADVSQEQSVVSALQSQADSLSSQHESNESIVSSLESQISSATSSVIPGLQSSVQSLVSELAAWKAGGFPVSFEWDFDDGTTSYEAAPTHVWSQSGVYNPTLTVSVTTPDGNVWAHTFAWHAFLIGHWPSSIQSGGGGGGLAGGTASAVVFDALGAQMPQLKVLQIVRPTNVWTGVSGAPQNVRGPGNPLLTNSNGAVSYSYAIAGTVRWVVLRNPLQNVKIGLEAYE